MMMMDLIFESKPGITRVSEFLKFSSATIYYKLPTSIIGTVSSVTPLLNRNKQG